MSRSYLSKRQVEWERASLDVQEAKHKRLVTRHAETMAWMYSLCTPDYCREVDEAYKALIAWSERDLQRWRRKVERLERERSRKRRVKRATRRRRREQREAERLL